ncbi:MAG: FAD/NAD(P)-binding protein [Candidatus Sericytochromatia bacterium]|nr:FAD/NAD(P)-binding protein [Candidatus Sericytochromatia bacterium]
MSPALLPEVWRISDFRWETPQTFSLSCEKPEVQTRVQTLNPFRPGQFNMLYVFGVGEVPISISGSPENTSAQIHTIRKVGAVTNALAELKPGQSLGIRGPFGSAWPLHKAKGKDLVIVAGGLGLAPVRPVIYAALAMRSEIRSLTLLYGARQHAEILYADELLSWQTGAEIAVHITLDQATQSWQGRVGVVTSLIQAQDLDADRTLALICGPEIMMRYSAHTFLEKGLKPEQIYVSLERNMQCAVGFCGHCQYGPHFICKDGPVFRYDKVQSLLNTREV